MKLHRVCHRRVVCTGMAPRACGRAGPWRVPLRPREGLGELLLGGRVTSAALLVASCPLLTRVSPMSTAPTLTVAGAGAPLGSGEVSGLRRAASQGLVWERYDSGLVPGTERQKCLRFAWEPQGHPGIKEGHHVIKEAGPVASLRLRDTRPGLKQKGEGGDRTAALPHPSPASTSWSR